jgi:acyl dehydratase
MTVAPVVRQMTQARIDAYAAASGDFNAIHVDPSYAAGTPLGGTIAHGMLVLALIAEMMHEAHGRAWCESGRLRVRIKGITRCDDTVTASAALLTESAGVSEYAVQCANQHGEIVIDGRASVQAASGG